MHVNRSLIAVVLVGIVYAPSLAWAQATDQTAAEWIDHFSDEWDESLWGQEFRRIPDGYMREDDDSGWETRMLALRGLVRLGADALPVLHERLRAGDAPQRILAAQALGYIAADESREPLLLAAGTDEDAAVRLYAVDSLGMLGAASTDVDWSGLSQSETNGDVKKHINYAIERSGAPVDPAIVEALTNWDPASINSVAPGEPAPDFELKSAQGETIRLSDFRGKKAVVLVFVYGDT